MSKIKKILNHEVSEETNRSTKAKALKALCWFLAFMLCATVVSRAAYGVTVAIVSTEKPKSGSINRSLEVDGILKLSGGVPVIAPSGALVNEVAVSNGDTMKEGDLLFKYDIKDFQQKISSAEMDIKGMELELADLKNKGTITDDKNDTSVSRKEEDIKAIEKNYDLKLQELNIKRRNAKNALAKYDDVRRSDYDGEEYTEEEYELLRSNYRSLDLEYEQMQNDKAKAILDVERDIEDIAPEDNSTSIAMKELSIKKIRLELNQLYSSVKTKGEAYAPVDGIIRELKVSAGAMTPSEASAFIGGEGDMEFSSTITKDDKKLIDVGDSVILTLYGDKNEHKGLKVKSLEPNSENPENYDMVVDLGENQIAVGSGGKIKVTKKSKSYETCVPLSCVYSENNKSYIYVVDKIETTLGTESISRKVDVIVHEKNDSTAAISGSLYRDTMVISASNKPLSDGSKIRLDDKK